MGYYEAMTKSDIRLSVVREDESVSRITWEADDAPAVMNKEAKAMLLALWDAESRNSLRIDLWTQDMTVQDMNDFFYQTLLTMADTYQNATKNKGLMAEIKIFAREFADKAAKFEAKQSRMP